MSNAVEIKVPDIGDFSDVPVIEVYVKVGDEVSAEEPLVSLESDKATMDVPAPQGGVIESIVVNVGDKVSEGSVLMTFKSDGASAGPGGPNGGTQQTPAQSGGKEKARALPSSASSPGGVAEVRVPDIGDFSDVPVIEIYVKEGDQVKAEDPLVALESDKATMDVPAPLAGTIKSLKVSVGDKVSEGKVILTLMTDDAGQAKAQASGDAAGGPASAGGGAKAGPGSSGGATQGGASRADARGGGGAATAGSGGLVGGPIDEEAFRKAYASPAVRMLARELNVNLGHIKGSGDHGRILREDVEAASKGASATGASAKAAGAAAGGIDLLPWPKVDFAKFGPVERKELSRIKKISAANLHRNWVVIPHVTSQDEADITELEQFRQQMNKELEKSRSGVKLSMLPFMMKAAVATLQKFPEFNASLDGDALVLKKYWHIGFAADTPNGLVVPVVRDCDKKSVTTIAREMAELAALARDGKLKSDQMQGATFTISSLGGIGGTFFTPIINAPEVAIMGACRSYWKQVSSDGRDWRARLIQPLSLSWDHRVIDGAAAARFNAHFANLLADMRRVLI